MTKKAEFRYRVRQIRAHAAKLEKLVKDPDPNGPAWERAHGFVHEGEERLSMLILRIERGEV